MNEPTFDHEKLDVYRLSIDSVGYSCALAAGLSGNQRHARDQWLRAAQSIPLNIAEGKIEHEHEHRDAEHEHEEEPEQSIPPKARPLVLEIERLLAATR